MIRRVQAPAPVLTAGAALPPNRVLSVELEPGERVEWIWSSGPGGMGYVSGYTIIRSRRAAGPLEEVLSKYGAI